MKLDYLNKGYLEPRFLGADNSIFTTHHQGTVPELKQTKQVCKRSKKFPNGKKQGEILKISVKELLLRYGHMNGCYSP